MIVPYSCLKDLLTDLPPPEELADILLMAGLEVEELSPVQAGFNGIKVGKVEAWEPHPFEPRLHVARVNVGDRDSISIVCGAQNVFPGAVVPVAMPSSALSGREIQVREFSGIPSYGMLCSREELSLDRELFSVGEGGIAILPPDTPIGKDLAQVLGLPDFLLNIKVTANRPDWFSIYGLAREIGVFTGSPVSLKEFSPEWLEEEASAYIDLEIQAPDLCFLYLATVIFGVRAKESPLWLKSLLWKSGLRPINNVVDATNYVMLLVGQPLHAFDYDNISQKKIVVRCAKALEAMVTLDGEKRKLEEDMLLIADPEKPIGIAGVMGGENSEVKESTTRVVLESAYFAPFSIRRTSRKLGLRTEASQRFERGTNVEQVELGSHLATQLISSLSGSKVLKGVVRKGREFNPRSLPLRPFKVNLLLSTNFSEGKIISDLKRLHLPVQKCGEELEVEIPLWRNDISEEADLIEDIARLNGYENIPSSLPKGEVRKGQEPLWRMRWRELRPYLLHCGLQEIITSPLISPRLNEFQFLMAAREEVKILNPISQERSVLRRSILPSILNVISLNERVGEEFFGFFELGKVYLSRGQEELPEEPRVIGLVLSAKKVRNWKGEETNIDFFSLKGLIEEFLEGYGLEFQPDTCNLLHSGRSAAIYLKGEKVGILGELSLSAARFWDLKERVLVAEILFQPFLEKPASFCFQQFSRYPKVRRDIAVVVNNQVPYLELERVIREASGAFLEKLEFFDFYRGPNTPSGKKSLAFTLIFRNPQRTLTEEEVSEYLKNIESSLASNFKAELRKN